MSLEQRKEIVIGGVLGNDVINSIVKFHRTISKNMSDASDPINYSHFRMTCGVGECVTHCGVDMSGVYVGRNTLVNVKYRRQIVKGYHLDGTHF